MPLQDSQKNDLKKIFEEISNQLVSSYNAQVELGDLSKSFDAILSTYEKIRNVTKEQMHFPDPDNCRIDRHKIASLFLISICLSFSNQKKAGRR